MLLEVLYFLYYPKIVWADSNLGHIQAVESSSPCCEPNAAFQGLASQKTYEDCFFLSEQVSTEGKEMVASDFAPLTETA